MHFGPSSAVERDERPSSARAYQASLQFPEMRGRVDANSDEVLRWISSVLMGGFLWQTPGLPRRCRARSPCHYRLPSLKIALKVLAASRNSRDHGSSRELEINVKLARPAPNRQAVVPLSARQNSMVCPSRRGSLATGGAMERRFPVLSWTQALQENDSASRGSRQCDKGAGCEMRQADPDEVFQFNILSLAC
jgi:hypothetical protein